jgi:hypothetical protein
MIDNEDKLKDEWEKLTSGASHDTKDVIASVEASLDQHEINVEKKSEAVKQIEEH